MSKIATPCKTHGGKHYLASRIVAMMPPHLTYCEPYAGGLSVLLAKNPEGVSEVVNDIDGDLMNFWECLADTKQFASFVRLVQAAPFSEVVWNGCARNNPDTNLPAGLPDNEYVDCALRFFVRCRQSLAGRGKSFAPISTTRTRRGMNEQVAAWLTAVDGLPAVHERLRRVAILSRPALDVIRQLDGPDTLFYLDPPYLSSTRTSPDVYRHEMSGMDHEELLVALHFIKGKFLLSGYNNTLYESAAHLYNWHRTDFDMPNNAAGGATKRRMTECVWTNFKPRLVAAGRAP